MKVLTSVGHLREEVMLLLAESALSPREARRAQAHLRVCAACRARSAALLQTDTELRTLNVARVTQDVHGREALLSLMADENREAPVGAAWRRWTWPRMLGHLGLVALLAFLLVALQRLHVKRRGVTQIVQEVGPRPDPRLTPGAVRVSSLGELCGLSDNNLDPQLAPDTVRAVYRAYGINPRAVASYQVDYLINPQLGGNDQMTNLWPEPNEATLWNAGAKDELERHLHWLVCSGQVDLSKAQHDLAADWIEAYKRYMGVQRPASAVGASNTPDEQTR